MKLLFRQRAFSWFDSYDIYDENENTVYVVKGQLSWGHCLKIYDPEEQQELGTVKEEILTWLPKFELYEGETCIGTLKKELTFFKPKYNIDFNGWHVEGDVFEWDYTITGPDGGTVAAVSKEPFHWTDTYAELTRINEKKRNDSCRSSFCIADSLLVVSHHHLAGLVDVAAAEGDDKIALPGVLLDPLGGLL